MNKQKVLITTFTILLGSSYCFAESPATKPEIEASLKNHQRKIAHIIRKSPNPRFKTVAFIAAAIGAGTALAIEHRDRIIESLRDALNARYTKDKAIESLRDAIKPNAEVANTSSDNKNTASDSDVDTNK